MYLSKSLFAGLMFLLVAAFQCVAEADTPEIKIIPYKNAKTIDGETVDLRLHIFSPEARNENAKRPAIVFFFGGGWNGGTPKQFYEQSKHLASRGLVCCCAEYRVKQRHGTTPFECVTDGKSAVRWIRQHATDLGIDPDRIIAAGGSAGGHVAACTALITDFDEENEQQDVSSVPNAMVLFNPVLDTTQQGYGSSRFEANQQTVLSPVHHIRKDAPPTLLFHGTADKTVPFENAERFCRLMKEAGNSCELISFENEGHGFFNGPEFRPNDKAAEHFEKTMQATVDFLKSMDYPITSPAVPSANLSK